MVKTHEINLITSVFNQVQTSNYIILEQDKDNLFETLMENESVITALREIDDKLKYAISTGLTHINYTNNNTNLMDKIMFVLEYMGFNVNDKYMHDENLSYIIIYL